MRYWYHTSPMFHRGFGFSIFTLTAVMVDQWTYPNVEYSYLYVFLFNSKKDVRNRINSSHDVPRQLESISTTCCSQKPHLFRLVCFRNISWIGILHIYFLNSIFSVAIPIWNNSSLQMKKQLFILLSIPSWSLLYVFYCLHVFLILKDQNYLDIMIQK